MKTLSDELDSLPVGSNRSENVHKQREIFNWFNDQQDVFVTKFSLYLQLEH